MRALILILTGCALAVAGDTPDRTRSAGTASKRGSQPARGAAPERQQADGIRDVLLMLDEGPLHLRFHISIDGTPLAAARDAYVDRLIKSLDTDGDGKLSPEEAAHSPLLTTKRRGRAGEFFDSIDAKRSVTRADIMKSVERVGGETVVYRQNSSASENDHEVFKVLDLDGSGYLDQDEMAAAASRILERDQDQDECISFDEFLPEPDPNEQPSPVALLRGGSPPPRPEIVAVVRDISDPFLPQRLIQKYDRNRDKKLTAEELGWDAERVRMLDRNSDGKLSTEELAARARRGDPPAIATTPVDLELAVDLAGAPEGQSALNVLATTGKRLDDARRPDVMRLVFAKAVITLSFRKIDPIKTAIEKAMQSFNQLDADGNGYLDKKETALGVRFETGLFDALDADGDGKIFGEEMEKYVSVRGEPAATAARVHLYDTGRGFFEALDTNGDGRISMREMKFAAKSLQAMSPRPEKLMPTDAARNFHIEFVRGSYLLFGPAEEAVSQVSATYEQRVPIGPIWFIRMDRNNDGDLTWNEFLGPRDVFHRIDKDGDGLIDPQEAEAFREE